MFMVHNKTINMINNERKILILIIEINEEFKLNKFLWNEITFPFIYVISVRFPFNLFFARCVYLSS